MKKFKPMKAPNEDTSFEREKDKFYLGDAKYPMLASTKLDGVRDIFLKERMVTCSLKNIPNKQLNEKFEPIRKYSEENGIVLDGEIYAPNIPFQFIVSCVMTQDYYDKKAIKSWDKLCKKHDFFTTREEVYNNLKFYCFDCVENDDFDKPYINRVKDYEKVSQNLGAITNTFYMVTQRIVNSVEEVEAYFEEVLEQGFEGLILRDINGRYKFGRGTLKEGLIYKVKPWVTLDAQIIAVIQATKVDPSAEKKVNELGRSVTSKKKGDRILIEKASAFLVKYEGKEVKPTLKMNDEEKIEVWEDRKNCIGKWIEYKGMLVGAKDVPRHPTFVRWRPDKDER